MKLRHPAVPVPTERAEQKALVAWARTWSSAVPELATLFAVPNGGHRDKRVAAQLAAEGVLPGVPDLFLPVARGMHHGLFVELKRARGGRLSPAQRAMIERLSAAGYRVAVCPGWDAARDAIVRYLGLEQHGALARGALGGAAA